MHLVIGSRPGKNQSTDVAYGIPAIHPESYTRDRRERSSRPGGGGVGDDTFMLPPPAPVPSRCNVLYLPSDSSKQR